MTPPYLNAAEFYFNCHVAYVEFADMGRKQFPGAQPSHLCVRSQSPNDFDQMKRFSESLGEVTEQTHKDKPILFVRLHKPLSHRSGSLGWLEITAPDANKKTGPDTLVFAQDNFAGDPVKHIVRHTKHPFYVRCQQKSAEQILHAQKSPV